MKLENILIPAIIVTALFVTMALFYAELTTVYTVDSYYEENFTSFESSIDNITYAADQSREAYNKLNSKNLLDIIGGLKQGAYSGILLFGGSFNVITNIFTQGIGIFNLGEVGPVWIIVAGTAMLIVFFVAIAARYLR